jgi:hypothetical protein
LRKAGYYQIISIRIRTRKKSTTSPSRHHPFH